MNTSHHRLSAFLMLLSFLLLAGVIAFGDTIRLKNGSIIKGKVVSFNQQEFTIVLDLGSSSRKSSSRMVIAAEDIESIEFNGADSVDSQSTSSGSSQAPAGKYSDPPREPSPATTSRKNPPSVEPQPEPETTAPAAPATSTPTSTNDSVTSGGVTEKTIRISSKDDWTSTDIRVQRGQRITITASGEIDLGNGQVSSPSGITTSDTRKLILNKPTGALIAVVGDDNDDFVYVGRSGEFTAAHNGILFLSVNEGNLKDNTGYYEARVKIGKGK